MLKTPLNLESYIMLHYGVAYYDIPLFFLGNIVIYTQCTQTSLRRLQEGHDVLRPNQTSSRRLAEDVLFATSWRRLICNVLKTSVLWRLEDVGFTSSWRRPIYGVLKTSDLRRLEDVAFTTSSWRRLICDVLRMSVLRRLEDVWSTTS